MGRASGLLATNAVGVRTRSRNQDAGLESIAGNEVEIRPFTLKRGEDYIGKPRYIVSAADGTVLGSVCQSTRSTDSRIAGTRLRRAGKGAISWFACVPDELRERPTDMPETARICNQIYTSIEYGSDGKYAEPASGLRMRGKTFDTRKEAVEALLFWVENPHSRQPAFM